MLLKIFPAILFGWISFKNFFFRNYTVIIAINNDSLNFYKTHTNRIAGNPLKSKMSP